MGCGRFGQGKATLSPVVPLSCCLPLSSLSPFAWLSPCIGLNWICYWVGLGLLTFACMVFGGVFLVWKNGKRPRVYVRGKSHGHNAGVLALALFSVLWTFGVLIICWCRKPANQSKNQIEKNLCKPSPTNSTTLRGLCRSHHPNGNFRGRTLHQPYWLSRIHRRIGQRPVCLGSKLKSKTRKQIQ